MRYRPVKPWQWLLILGVVGLAIVGGSTVVQQAVNESDVVQRFAEAIAFAEGFWLTGSQSGRKNNPGDIKDASGNVATYATPNDGWAALTHQVGLMFNGGSSYYDPTMTIRQVGYVYADGLDDPTGAANWSRNVASYLVVPADTTLQSLMS